MSHNQFKIFKGALSSFSGIKSKMEAFVSENKVSARSIGIEFIEHSKEILVSLGYSKEGSYSAISIDMINLGKVDLGNTDAIEKLMSAAADKQQNVICHELCITDTNEFMMVFMSTKA